MRRKLKLTVALFTPCFAYSQAYGGNSDQNPFLSVLIALAIVIIVFLIIRQIVLWYFRVNTIVENLEKTNNLLQNILNEQKKISPSVEENSIIQSQDGFCQIYFFKSNPSPDQWMACYKGNEIGEAKYFSNSIVTLHTNELSGINVPAGVNEFELKTSSESKMISVKGNPDQTVFIDVFKY